MEKGCKIIIELLHGYRMSLKIPDSKGIIAEIAKKARIRPQTWCRVEKSLIFDILKELSLLVKYLPEAVAVYIKAG